MDYIAAIYAGGKVVTGTNHGDAFGKLTITQQDGEVTSGFLDPQTGRFFTDNVQFFIKKIILIRHAEADDKSITDFGRLQCERTANFLLQFLDISQYTAFACVCDKVLETATAICSQIGLSVKSNSRFCDPQKNETDFLTRLQNVIESLPDNTVIISHSNFVVNMAQLALGSDITQCSKWKNKIPNCSITYVENHQPIWIGEDPI